MSLLAPSYALAESGYTLQLRPLQTTKEDAEAGRQHYAVCLWFDKEGTRREICAMSGFIIPIIWREGDGHPDLFEAAKRRILINPEEPAGPRKRGNDAEMNPFHKGHVRWLADDVNRQAFEDAIDVRIKG